MLIWYLRSGKIVLKAKMRKKIKENIEKLINFDRDLLNDYEILCGIDEAGRGPLAGPVVAAAVILDYNNLPEMLGDSKQLNESERELAHDQIVEKSVAYGIGIVEAEEIDRINILKATFLAMKKAKDQLNINTPVYLIDGRDKPFHDVEQIAIVKGDSKSAAISAASILAKVTRDRIMVTLGKTFPEYNFEKNKGYGTKEHIEVIKKIGKSISHRKSFKLDFEKEEQLKLF
ncbi:MAG: ribonuclease HII [Candidatus Delongbacteria bacterium]|nr:ribonuclease HII [Candidatus Delongbacteria bacterium]MBN2835151.1 ribonuclease HII [Candidatus Delongbacteria bacterium]